jgi:mucin-19
MGSKRITSRNINNPNARLNSASLPTIKSGVLPYTLGYLLVAGGGAGGGVLGQGFSGGGGGAGGLIQGNASVMPGLTITVTVGAGGATNTPAAPGYGPTAGNTTLSGGLVITAYGGGMGMQGWYPYQSAPTGSPSGSPYYGDGGSGGGSFWDAGLGLNRPGLAFGSPGATVTGSQGYPGGPHGGSMTGATGGGGAGGAGVTQGLPGQAFGASQGTIGGPGISSFLTPPTSIYAGGGGGGYGSGVGSPTTAPSLAAPGGGGISGWGNVAPGNQAGQPGGQGLGGGGGGGAGQSNAPAPTVIPGGAGGSGVAKFAVPTPAYNAGTSYSGSNVTVSTPPAVPGMTVITFNSSGTLTT